MLLAHLRGGVRVYTCVWSVHYTQGRNFGRSVTVVGVHRCKKRAIGPFCVHTQKRVDQNLWLTPTAKPLERSPAVKAGALAPTLMAALSSLDTVVTRA